MGAPCVLVLRSARPKNAFVRLFVRVSADVAHVVRGGAETWLSPGSLLTTRVTAHRTAMATWAVDVTGAVRLIGSTASALT